MDAQNQTGMAESKRMQHYFNQFGEEVLALLEDYSRIQLDFEIENPEIRENINKISHVIKTGIRSVRVTLQSLIDNAEWETVNIGFFGETNAGKTTLIEALTANNGRAIGDGRKDFTRHVGTVRLWNLNFFDMPGIEGYEEAVKNEIQRAVQKCHVVFYIYRGDKQPEKPTLEKIREYLADFAKVYSIMNISGKARSYKYNRKLIGENELKVEKESIQAFKNTLEGHYDSNLMMQAHLAYLARGNPAREDLLKEKQIALEFFQTEDKILDYSRFAALHNQLSQISADGIKEITVSNFYKLLRDIETVLNKVLLEKREYDRAGKQMRISLNRVRGDLKVLVGRSENRLKNTVSSFFKQLENSLIRIIFQAIENKKTKKEMETQLENFLKGAEKNLQIDMDSIGEEIEKDIKNLTKQFQQTVLVDFQKVSFASNFDLTAIVEQLRVTVGYITRQLMDSIVSLLTTLLASLPLGVIGIVVLVLTVIRKSLDIFFWDPKKRKRKARGDACRLINEQLNPVRDEVFEKIEQKLNTLDIEISKKMNAVFEFVEGLYRFTLEMDQAIASLYDTKVQIFTALARFLFGKKVNLAHVDLELQEAILIGEDIADLNPSAARIGTCHKYSSLQNFLDNVAHEIKGDVLFLKETDEFKKRSVGAFKKQLNLAIITGAYYEK